MDAAHRWGLSTAECPSPTWQGSGRRSNGEPFAYGSESFVMRSVADIRSTYEADSLVIGVRGSFSPVAWDRGTHQSPLLRRGLRFGSSHNSFARCPLDATGEQRL